MEKSLLSVGLRFRGIFYEDRQHFRYMISVHLARIIHELVLRDCEDGRTTGQPQGLESEAYLNSTSQGSRPEDAWKGVHIHSRSS